MAAGFHHFIIEQGATFGRTLTLKDSSDALVNLTGYSAAEMDLRFNADDSSEVLEVRASKIVPRNLNSTASGTPCESMAGKPQRRLH